MTFFVLNSNNELKKYIIKINKYPILDIKEELELSKNFYYKNDLKSVKKIILSNLRFVINISKNYFYYGLPQFDLIQEGNIGLIKAIKNFNPNIGIKLISFAIYWIKSEIIKYILKNLRIVKILINKSNKNFFFNFKKIKKNTNWFNFDELNYLSNKFKISIKNINIIEKFFISKDINIDNYIDKFEKNNFLLSNNYIDFFKKIEEDDWKNYFINKIKKSISKLDKKSQDIIYSRWLTYNNRKTLKYLSIKYNLSLERIRQLEKNALLKIKKMIF